SMGTATLLPWGLRSQRTTVIVGAAVGIAAVVVVGGGSSVEVGYATVAMAVAMVTSVAAASQIDQHRTALLERNLALDEAQRLARVGSWDWQIPTNQVTWSPELYRIFGRTPQEFHATYEAFVEYVHPEDRGTVRNTIARALSRREPFDFDHRIVRPDGTVRTLHAMGTVVAGDDGSPIRMFGTGQDVTEQKEVEEALARARDEALEAAALKSAFLANVSHEIRTPLNIIVGYNEFIAERLSELGDDSLQESQGGIQRACNRLLDTIHGILDFSRMEAGAFEVRAAPIDLGPSIEQVVKDVRPLTAQKGLALSFDNHAPGTVVRFDEYCLSSALLNLLQNAIKFTEKGSISVRLHRLDGELRLEVRDTGIGIAPGFLPRLFEAFVQEDSGFNRQFEGSGLGLALTRRYLEFNGASIDVDSKKGRGSTFTIRFPARCAEPDAAMRAAEPASRRAG
ncbi:MAG: ATP-binding protein, partial [Candidatus Binatia bacterium]